MRGRNYSLRCTLERMRRFWSAGRQPFRYKIREELPVTRALSEEIPENSYRSRTFESLSRRRCCCPVAFIFEGLKVESQSGRGNCPLLDMARSRGHHEPPAKTFTSDISGITSWL